MGFDTSFHPVDLELVDRVLEHVLGSRKIDDLNGDIVRLVKVRHRANAWGLGVIKLASQSEKRDEPRGFLQKFMPKKKATPAVPATFETDLHIWGRPFFVTDDGISEGIDRYLAASVPQDVDRIAQDMIDRLAPNLSSKVLPDEESGLPADEEILGSARSALDCLADAVVALRSGKTVTTPNGEEVAPQDVLLNHTAFSVIEFASIFRPGWMSRGYSWPTNLLAMAEIECDDIFESSASLFSPITELLPALEEKLQPTIDENYMVGGYVPPNKVAVLAKRLENARDKVLSAAQSDGWNAREIELQFKKLQEAVRDAQLRRFGFIEATEIYSGFEGRMN